MRQHQHARTAAAQSKGVRPDWLIKAHETARHRARIGSHGQKPGEIETREETEKGRLKAIVAESRIDLPIPTGLKAKGIKSVFAKINTATEIIGESTGITTVRSRALVVAFAQPQNGIAGLPVTRAQARKLRTNGFNHLVITSVPKAAREREQWEALANGRYDESGWWIGFYKPKGGHHHRDEKGGELVQDFQSELFVLQYLYENGLTGLYEVPLIASWNLLPKRDDDREEENAATAAIQMVFGRSGRLHAEASYHRARLHAHFHDIFREGASDEDELEQKVRQTFAETVIGQSIIRRVEEGTFEHRTFYVSDDNGTAYAMHNTVDGQLVTKIDLRSRSIEVGLVKQDLNGLALMELYDDFLTSQRFRQIPWQEFSARTVGISLADLGRRAS